MTTPAPTDAAMASATTGDVRLRRPDRAQVTMRCECDDDLIPAGHPARTIWSVVTAMDLSAFRTPIKAREGVAGRDATDPVLLVALWLYGCVRGIGSARELARRCDPAAEGSRPFLWLCGGVTVNHHMLSDFRVGHADALDALFTRAVASLVDRDLVKVTRASQDGVRVRASAGAASFRREERLAELLVKTEAHVADLRRQADDPALAAGESGKRAAAKRRAAEDRVARVQEAIAQLPDLKARRDAAAAKAGNGKCGQALRAKQPRASTTDADARVMKMPNGGFNPAFNVQLATDTESRAILGVAVTNEGTDTAGLSEPMRAQVERRTGRKVEQHLLDGGYFTQADLEAAHAGGVELFVPPKPARSEAKRGRELEPKPGDPAATLAWKARMASDAGKTVYKERAATSETANADLRCHRGLTQLTVRGLAKVEVRRAVVRAGVQRDALRGGVGRLTGRRRPRGRSTATDLRSELTE